MTIERNWAGTQVFEPRTVETPSPTGSLGERVRAVATAVQQMVATGRHVRPMGSMWSFGTILQAPDATFHLDALTDVIATRPRRLIANAAAAQGELEKALFAATSDPDEAWALVGAGIDSDTLIATMDRAGLSPITLGSSTGQRLGGVTATASHGADFRLAPIADMALAVVLLRGDGQVLWIEGKQAGSKASRLAFARSLVSSVDDVISDDAALDAARASVGVLGVVAAMLLKARERYGLIDVAHRLPWSQIRPTVKSGGTAFGDLPPWPELAARPHPDAKYRFLEILLNPYPNGGAGRDALVVTRWERPGDAADEPKPKTPLPIIETYLHIILGNQGAYRTTIDQLQDSVRPGTGKFLRAYRVMSSGGAPGYKVHSYDVGVPVKGDLHLKFLDALLSKWDALIAQDKKFTGFLSMRFTGGTRALLGMEHAGLTAHFEIFALQRPKNLAIGQPFPLDFDPSTTARDSPAFLACIADAVKAVGDDARYHWGQMGPIRLVPAAQKPWYAQFDRLRGPSPRVAFANEAVLIAGLVPPPERFAFTSTLATRAADAPLAATGIALTSAAACETTLYALNGDGWVSALKHQAGGPSSWARVYRTEQGKDDDAPASSALTLVGSLAAAANADGHHEVFARSSPNGYVLHRWALTGAVAHLGWSEWARLHDATFASDPSAVKGKDGKLVVTAIGLDGKLRYAKQNQNGGLVGWDDWKAVTAPTGIPRMTGRPRVLRLTGGELLLASGHDHVWATPLTTGWLDLGAAPFGFGAAASSDGKKLAVARLTDRETVVIDVRKTPTDAPTTRTVTLPDAIRPDTELAVRVADDRVTVAVTLITGAVAVLQSNGSTTHFEGVEATSGPTLLGIGGGKTALYARVAHDLFVWRTW